MFLCYFSGISPTNSIDSKTLSEMELGECVESPNEVKHRLDRSQVDGVYEVKFTDLAAACALNV